MKHLTKLFLLLSLFAFSVTGHAKLDIQTWHTQQGSKVLYVSAPELPMVDIEMTFDAGSIRDGKVYGLASFTSAMIGSGTSKMSESEISDSFNRLGVQYSASAGRDNAAVSFRSLTRDSILKPGFELFTEVVSDLQLNDEIIERDRARVLIGIKRSDTQASSVARKVFWQNLYGDHPYAHPVSGNEDTIKALTKTQLKQFYQTYYVAKNAQIVIVGAVSRQQAESMAESLSSALPKGQKAPEINVALPKINGELKVVNFDATQTHYRLAQHGVERGHPDYHALFLGNHLFGGGGFGSLLMEEVREKRGLVYSVHSAFYPMKFRGPFLVALSTKNASAKEADQVVKETLTNFLKDFSDEQFQASKDNLVGGFPLRFDSNSKKLGYLSMIGYYDMPLTYLEDFPKKIAALSKQDVLKAWNKHIQPEKMMTQMVGQPK